MLFFVFLVYASLKCLFAFRFPTLSIYTDTDKWHAGMAAPAIYKEYNGVELDRGAESMSDAAGAEEKSWRKRKAEDAHPARDRPAPG